MKCVILGNTKLNYSWFVLTFRQGLQLNNHEVIEIDYKSTKPEEIRKKLLEIKPNVIFTHLTFHNIYPIDKMLNYFEDIKNKIDCKFIHTLNDAREEPRYNKDISKAFHMAFLNQTKNLEKFQKYWKIPVIFAPYCSLTHEKIGNYNKNLDFNKLVFMGSMCHTERINLLKKLQNMIPLQIFQTQSKEDKRHQTLDLAASNHAILSACTGYEITHYNEVRPWQLLGSGACMIHKKFHKEEDLIPEDLYYHHDFEPKQIREIYMKITKTDTSELRQKAFNFIQKYHSSRVRLQNIMNVIEGKQETTKSFVWEI